MESPEQDMVLSLASEPQQERQDKFEPEPQSDQETPEPNRVPPPLELIELRIQHLHHRRFLLLKIKDFREKAQGKSGRTAEEMTCVDSNEVNELEGIQKELEELMLKIEELKKQGSSSELIANGGQEDEHPDLYKTEPPCGGIYTLPPHGPTREDVTLEPRVKTGPAEETPTPTDTVVSVANLGWRAAVTRCPACDKFVLTETCSKVGETIWLLCCLLSMMGCVSGCCVIPFFVDRWRNVQHKCPQCQAHIHTYRPI